MIRSTRPAVIAVALAALAAVAAAQQWQAPSANMLQAPTRGAAPLLAATIEELQRLREALAAKHSAIVPLVERARHRLGEAVVYPPRGGQHNQWYQCDACQRALETIDDTHHRCEGCGKVYSGAPWDDVVFSRRHAQNLARAHDAAWAHALTGEQPFASDAAAILLGYAARYESYPHHCNAADPTQRKDSGGHLKEQTLSEASWFVTMIAPAIDLVWPTLDEPARRQVLEHLVRPLVDNLAGCRRGRSNWQSWHNAAMFAGAVLLGDERLLQRSILDQQNGFLFQMQACVSAEGMWYENSFGYHLYTLDALVAHAAIARRAGIDLFGHPTLRNMATLPARYTMADGRLPRLGDDVDSSPLRASRALEAVFAATRDARLLAVLPSASGWESILYGRETGNGSTASMPARLGSELFRDAGHGILRAGDNSALLSWSPFGGFHGHFDKLSFVWHANGRERGIDPGRAASQAYRLPIHAQWYRATLAHNAVVVGGRSQAGAAGELLGFREGAGFTAVAARTTKAYPGVDHRRCLWLTDRYLVVIDLLTSEKDTTFDWLYHDDSARIETDAAAGTAEGVFGLDGETFVSWSHAGESEQGIAARFLQSDGAVAARLHVAGGTPTLVRTGTGPFRSIAERAPFVVLRRSGVATQFAAVLSADGASPSDISGIRCESSATGVTVVVERGAANDRLHWDGTGVIEPR